jgi:hypothetical protein
VATYISETSITSPTCRWHVSTFRVYPQDGGSVYHRNVSSLSHIHTSATTHGKKINSSLSWKCKISHLLHLWLTDKSSSYSSRRVELILRTNGFVSHVTRGVIQRIPVTFIAYEPSRDETRTPLQLGSESSSFDAFRKYECVFGYLTRKTACVILWNVVSGVQYDVP